MRISKLVGVGVILLLGLSQAYAEYRVVLVQLQQDKDKKTSVTIYSDDPKDRKSEISVDDAAKAIGTMKGWGSGVGVYVNPKQEIPNTDLRKIFNSIFDNGWLNLVYFGRDVPKLNGENFPKEEPQK